MAQPGVYVAGVRELRSALRRMDSSLLPEVREGLRDAGQVVARDAKRRVRASIKNPSRSSGRAEGSIRITVGGNKVYIVGGKARVPYFGWLDFGGTLRPSGGRRNTINRSRPSKGRYIYPAIGSNIDEVVRGIEKAVRSAARKAGLA